MHSGKGWHSHFQLISKSVMEWRCLKLETRSLAHHEKQGAGLHSYTHFHPSACQPLLPLHVTLITPGRRWIFFVIVSLAPSVLIFPFLNSSGWDWQEGAEDRALLRRVWEKILCVSLAVIGSCVHPGITPRSRGSSRPNFAEAQRLEGRGLFAEDGGRLF